MNGSIMTAGAILVLAGIKNDKDLTHVAVFIFGFIIIIISAWM
jgi:hypothetical protein